MYSGITYPFFQEAMGVFLLGDGVCFEEVPRFHSSILSLQGE